MSYLYTDSSFLGNYDSLVESCFDYAYEREDECLFESMILNELSDDLKLRAATKVLTKVDTDQYFVDSDLKDAKDFKNKGDEYIANNFSKSAQRYLSSYGKTLSGKRNRLLNYYLNSENGTKYRAYDLDQEVNEYDKNRIHELLNNQNSREIQHIYEKLRSEVESLNKDNPGLPLNKFGKPLYKMPKIKVGQKINNIHTDVNNVTNNINDNTNTTNSTDTSNTINDNSNTNNRTINRANRAKSLPARLKQRIRVFIKSLKRKYNNIKRKINNTPPEQRSLLQKFMHKIIQIIDKVSGWLSKKGE